MIIAHSHPLRERHICLLFEIDETVLSLVLTRCRTSNGIIHRRRKIRLLFAVGKILEHVLKGEHTLSVLISLAALLSMLTTGGELRWK